MSLARTQSTGGSTVQTGQAGQAGHAGQTSTTGRPAAGGFRPDIEGLRAVAIGLVVAYHAGVPAVTGGFVGVDVFFVLSGFLITGMLVDEIGRTGTVSIAGFYARRIRRLLPQSTLVLVSTAVAAVFLLDPLARAALARDTGWAALYGANWNYASELTDYMASGVSKSPLLHFWSLGVEEQFYLLWPALLLALLAVLRHTGDRTLTGPAGRRYHRWVTGTLLLLGTVSLWLSATTTAASGPWAYYGLHTRAWELAAGGLLALGRARWPSLPTAVRGGCGWLGAAAVVASALLITPQTHFPGMAALAPVGGTMLLVLAGAGGASAGMPRLLSHPVLRYIGRVSYAWYLWHWPCLVLWNALPGEPDARPWPWTLLVVAVSLLLAAITELLVENPLRHSRWLAQVRRRSLVFGVMLTLLSVAAAGLLGVQARHSAQAQTVAATADAMTPEQADADKVTGLQGCHVGFGATNAAPAADCTFGDPAGDFRVALIGDSHAEHWFPALKGVAGKRHWRVTVWTKDTCPAVDAHVWVDVYQRPYPECDQWRASMYDRLAQAGPFDLVVVAHSWKYVNNFVDRDERVSDPARVRALWTADTLASLPKLTAAGTRVVILRDGPKAPSNVPRCLAKHDGDPSACAFARHGNTHLDRPLYRAERAALTDFAEHSADAAKRVRIIDPTTLICGTGPTCPVITATGLIIYRDDSHLTQTFSTSLGPAYVRLLGVPR